MILKPLYRPLLFFFLGGCFFCCVGIIYNIYLFPRGEVLTHVCFTPHQRCLESVLKGVGAAKKTIWLQGYAITSKSIGGALIEAHRRGVGVVVVADKSQRTMKTSIVKDLRGAGIPVFIDNIQGIAHSKIMILDGAVVFTGSYNWTPAAENRNAENLVRLSDKKVVDCYKDNFQKRLKVSKRF